jgi:hypothetical protein
MVEDKIIWKRLIYQGKDYGDLYLVSNTGEIKGVKTGKIRKKNVNHEGYYFVACSLGSRDNKITFKVHKAVAETFIDNIDNYPVVNHIDGNKLNNNVENLEWVTYRENTLHVIKTNLINNDHSKRKVICLNNNIIFDSIKCAAVWCGCNRGTLSDYLGCRKDKRKTAGKHPETKESLTWMYYDDYIKQYKNVS